MVFTKSLLTAATASAMCLAASVQAATVPFTEDFTANNANWTDAANAGLGFVAAGGPDGSGYTSMSFSFAGASANDDIVMFRGQDNNDASGDAFVGNWISDGVTQVTAYVRHNANMPVNFFLRAARPANFPGAVAIDFVPVQPNTWTQITFDVTPTSTQIVTFEGSSHGAVFSNIGNVQFGVRTPAGLAGSGVSVTFDLDQPTITPEPASLGLFATGALVMLRRRH